MATDAQKRAVAKYQREKMKQISIRFSPNEMDMYEFLKAQDNTAGFIKDLVKQEMTRRNQW